MNMKTNRKIWLSSAKKNIPENVPLIFWDTCALLDIVRTPIIERSKLNFNSLQAYERITDYIMDQKVISVTSEIVVKEFHEHIGDCIKALEQQSQRIVEQVCMLSKYVDDKKNS